MNESPQCPGYNPLRYTPVPDEVFDLYLSHLTEAQLKVLLTIIRHTYGWRKDRDRISLSQLERETGLSRPSVWKATSELQASGHILIARETRGRGDSLINIYSLNVIADSAESSSQAAAGR